jgi:hypothetical protein
VLGAVSWLVERKRGGPLHAAAEDYGGRPRASTAAPSRRPCAAARPGPRLALCWARDW